VNVLLVEDDPSLAEFLSRVLLEEGATCTACGTLAAARAASRGGAFDVIVLDWMLPDGDGLALCSELRAALDTTPILMLTARGETPDRVVGLRAGADDYLVKPFDVEELLARLDALVRRAAFAASLTVGPLVIDRLMRRATLDGVALDLTLREFDLLLRLAVEAGRTVSRASLLQSVWRLTFDPGSGVLDVHLSRLRDKLGAHAWMVQTVRGAGYRLRGTSEP